MDESKEWIESGGIDPILGLKVRNFPCKAEPVMFLDDPGREEQNGVRFRVETLTRQLFTDIRIKPTPSMSKDKESVANPPYIVTYAEDRKTGKPVLITYENLEIPEVYKKTLPLSIQEWYAY